MSGPPAADTGRSTVALELSEASVPTEVSSWTSRVARLRIGTGERSASYLPERTMPDAPAVGMDGDTVVGGSVALRLVEETRELELLDDDGRPALRIAATPLAGGIGISCHIAGEQHFFGLGHGGDCFDRLGATRRLWASHINHGNGADIPVPVVFSDRGYGLFFDNAARATVTPDRSYRSSWLNYETIATCVDMYLLVGKDLRDAVSEFANLVGHPSMPPRWLLGFLQSTRHFETSTEVEGLAREMRRRNLPCDALIFLSTYGTQKGWNKGVGHLEWHPDLFPDPAATLGSLRAEGFRVLLHEYPVVHPGSPLHAEGKSKGYLLAETYPAPAPADAAPDNYREDQNYIDFLNREAGTWWWKQHRELGADGWWLDGGEGPAAGAEADGRSTTGLHNRFDLMRQQAFSDGEACDRPGRRPVMLCRSGGPGMQRFGAACWSGDINGSFETLERQVPLALSAAMSGIAYWGSDIGGFYTRRADEEELFVRWMQFGAFCPIFRAHGRDWRNRLPWAHGERAESICRRYMELRYRLLPYNYTLAWQAHRCGLPLMRPLALNYPEDARAAEVDYEFLWGDDLLVAPVTREGATRWPVYLPRGNWYDFWTGKRYAGPCAIEVDAPLGTIPVFVRGGSIIPMGPPAQHTTTELPDELTLLVHTEATASGALYEDDGDGHGRGGHLLTAYSAERTGDELRVSAHLQAGESAACPAARRHTVRIWLDANPMDVETGPEPVRTFRPWERDGAYIITSMPGNSSWVSFRLGPERAA